jgi:hypothetical protein
MPSKDIEKRRAAVRKHYYANREYYIKKSYKKRNELREWVYNLKKETPCMDCKKSFPYYVMDFDHIKEQGYKINTISRLINTGSIRQVKEEIEKCELVCANCHRIRTFSRLIDKNKI